MKKLSVYEKPIRLELAMLAISLFKEKRYSGLKAETSNSLSAVFNPVVANADYLSEHGGNIALVASSAYTALCKTACTWRLPIPRVSSVAECQYYTEHILKNGKLP